jgi:hypothetical protein
LLLGESRHTMQVKMCVILVSEIVAER